MQPRVGSSNSRHCYSFPSSFLSSFALVVQSSESPRDLDSASRSPNYSSILSKYEVSAAWAGGIIDVRLHSDGIPAPPACTAILVPPKALTGFGKPALGLKLTAILAHTKAFCSTDMGSGWHYGGGGCISLLCGCRRLTSTAILAHKKVFSSTEAGQSRHASPRSTMQTSPAL